MSSSKSSSSSSLHMLRGLYRSFKSPPSLQRPPQLNSQKVDHHPATSSLSSSAIHHAHPKVRSNPTTSYLIQFYREQQEQQQQQSDRSSDRHQERRPEQHQERTTNEHDDDDKRRHQQHQQQYLLPSIATDTLRLRNDMMERIRLQWLDAGVEEVLTPREMTRRAAARAGLSLPK